MIGTKLTAYVAAGALIVIGVMHWHTQTLKASLEAVRGDLTDKVAEVHALESAVATQNAKVADLQQTSAAMRENGRKAQQDAQEAIDQHQEVIAALRRDRPASCEPEALREKLLKDLLPEAVKEPSEEASE